MRSLTAPLETAVNWLVANHNRSFAFCAVLAFIAGQLDRWLP